MRHKLLGGAGRRSAAQALKGVKGMARKKNKGDAAQDPTQLAQDVIPIRTVEGSFIRRTDGASILLVFIEGTNDSLYTYDQKLEESDANRHALVALNRPFSIVKVPKTSAAAPGDQGGGAHHIGRAPQGDQAQAAGGPAAPQGRGGGHERRPRDPPHLHRDRVLGERRPHRAARREDIRRPRHGNGTAGAYLLVRRGNRGASALFHAADRIAACRARQHAGVLTEARKEEWLEK